MSLHSLLPYSTGHTWATLLSRKTSDVPSKFPPRAFIFTVPFARSAGPQWSALFLLTSYPGIVLISLCKITTPPSPSSPPDPALFFHKVLADFGWIYTFMVISPALPTRMQVQESRDFAVFIALSLHLTQSLANSRCSVNGFQINK